MGHTFGNIFLSTLEKLTGSIDEAVDKISELLRLRGKVLPATLCKVKLIAYLKNGIILRGQNTIYGSDLDKLNKIALEPIAKANPKALRAIHDADLIVIGPGDLYSSLIPNFLISGISNAIKKCRAKKLFICNLMNRAGQTENFQPSDYVKIIEDYIGICVDYIIYNTGHPPQRLLNRYIHEGECLVPTTIIKNKRYMGDKLISKKFSKKEKGDQIKRNLIRHNSDLLANLIVNKILNLNRIDV
ncbi:MAG: hypothetical protein A2174_01820 [Candidatus Portnoybacteria bacterium RBG_13_41_18]|uniref:YvcK family protein n=1 Tax=Candidatus Portnoybacteria bacterium RBG_13_41_18 TaxID=1801991 RepID=A0A1G2F5J9_9BACT|nr:MAG: hypothetical protein A2174_01820 [Candidatus Portnoybacteria bacterium RBG_13_41_18]